MSGFVIVEAETLSDAEDKALDAPLPSAENSEYVDDSIEIDDLVNPDIKVNGQWEEIDVDDEDDEDD
jgi:hypothetical protein